MQTPRQRGLHKGIVLSTLPEVTLQKGSNNTITVGGLFDGFDYKGVDLDRIVVNIPET